MAVIASRTLGGWQWRARPRRQWRPRWTLRLRLTLLYGAMFLVAGAILLTITYELVSHQTGSRAVVAERASKPGSTPVPQQLPPPSNGSSVFFSVRSAKPDAAGQAQLRSLAARANKEIAGQRNAVLDALLTRSGMALGLMAFVSIGLGWLMAGRALRPVARMSAVARGISERNLHERLAIEGPNDELKELGDTFDGLLGRLEAAFESQRRFVANASHELRTPITLSRALTEVALTDPQPTVASLRKTLGRVLAAGEQQEQLIEALLTLARSQRGLDAHESFDLATIAAEVLRRTDVSGIRLESELAPAHVLGDPALLERLFVNLLDNAVHYNVEAGWVRVSTGRHDRATVLAVSNSGPPIAEEQIPSLFEPFRRLNGARPAGDRGVGLGLSIVAAIAEAHRAQLRAHPRPEGGLMVSVLFDARP